MLSRGNLITQGFMKDLLGGEKKYRIAAVNRDTEYSLELTVNEGELQESIDSLRGRNLWVTRVEPVLKTLEEVYLSVSGGDEE